MLNDMTEIDEIEIWSLKNLDFPEVDHIDDMSRWDGSTSRTEKADNDSNTDTTISESSFRKTVLVDYPRLGALPQEVDIRNYVPTPERFAALGPSRYKYSIVSTSHEVHEMNDNLWSIAHLLTTTSPLAVDIEGESLSATGPITILIVHVKLPGSRYTYLVDVQTLGNAAFDIKGNRNTNLRMILEEGKIQKCFFDCRTDAEALFYQYKVQVQGVIDVQVFWLASEYFYWEKSFLTGLASCVESIRTLDASWNLWREKAKVDKEAGKRAFFPDVGGSFETMAVRPMSNTLIAYCLGDVEHLADLYYCYWTKMRQYGDREALLLSAHLYTEYRLTEARNGGWSKLDRKAKSANPWWHNNWRSPRSREPDHGPNLSDKDGSPEKVPLFSETEALQSPWFNSSLYSRCHLRPATP